MQNSQYFELNQYFFGLWYAAYRLLITSCLVLIFILTQDELSTNYEFPQLYFYVLWGYFFINCVQLFNLKHFKQHIPQQFAFIFIVDVIALSLLTIATNGPNLSISILFLTTIFAASLLLKTQKALIITLIAVIAVIYQQFFISFLTQHSFQNLGNSVILAVLFFVFYACGQIAVRRFQLLDHVNFSQSQELKRLQNINRYILEQIETGYLVLDENCHIVLSNPAACALLGIAPFYAFDKYPLYKLQPDLFELLDFDQVQNGEKFQFESQLSRYYLHIEVQKLIVPQQVLTLLVIQDGQKMNQQVQQLKLAALGQLSASIAHEIRNPLAAIVQANELLPNSTVDQQQTLSQMISKQTKRIDKIVQDTLSMVRNQGTQPISIQLDRFIPIFIQEDLPDLKTKILCHIAPQLSLNFDEAQFRQVLINLIRNAVRHNSPERSTIELHCYTQDKNIHIDVCDFGEGVAIHDQAHLFQPFFSTAITGTGLGLYLSHSFCEANQALLSYVEQQQGACFRIQCRQLT
ncbi:histidine kinase [Acinetobacter sp. ANC 4910]|uniref:sensor histidine kinase n=1 Tax=Acinetobacter sp. ANC 4910 TaxID=2529850 RepID=UPI00103EF62B|nr:ATP-binding protein [Acinetobacter sp. ANC 4910]TCB33623.1 histidine kinase [Acinetobacter sp. ANC 4910]